MDSRLGKWVERGKVTLLNDKPKAYHPSQGNIS